MDQIIANITRTLARQRRADGEFAVMVLGDHGMTVDGGHGGNTPRETHVPVILIKKGMEKLSDKGLLKPGFKFYFFRDKIYYVDFWGYPIHV